MLVNEDVMINNDNWRVLIIYYGNEVFVSGIQIYVGQVTLQSATRNCP